MGESQDFCCLHDDLRLMVDNLAYTQLLPPVHVIPTPTRSLLARKQVASAIVIALQRTQQNWTMEVVRRRHRLRARAAAALLVDQIPPASSILER